MSLTTPLDQYIADHSSPEGDYLYRLFRATHVEILAPQMASGHIQGRLLKFMVKMIRPRRILEIGTFTGYSALCMAEGLDEGGKLYTFEVEDELERYVVEMFQYQDTLYRDTTLTDERKAELSNSCYKAQRDAMTYIQEVIRKNINNMVGIFLLVQYSDLFDNNELSSLIAAIPGKLIDRDNNYLYDILLQIQEERNTPGTIDEIINAIEEEGEELKLEKNYNSEIEE